MTEEAKATKELAVFGTKALETGEKLGGFLSKVFGTLPEDVVGVVGGDWLRQVRIRNAARYAQRTEEILKERGISGSTEPLSPNVAISILEAAQDETREELIEMWARLLANGMDPKRRHLVRQSIINVVKGFDPLDAVVLEESIKLSTRGHYADVSSLQTSLKVTKDEFELSVSNLQKLDCLKDGVARKGSNTGMKIHRIDFTVIGREVIRATCL